jgi:hypothetical protein
LAELITSEFQCRRLGIPMVCDTNWRSLHRCTIWNNLTYLACLSRHSWVAAHSSPVLNLDIPVMLHSSTLILAALYNTVPLYHLERWYCGPGFIIFGLILLFPLQTFLVHNSFDYTVLTMVTNSFIKFNTIALDRTSLNYLRSSVTVHVRVSRIICAWLD